MKIVWKLPLSLVLLLFLLLVQIHWTTAFQFKKDVGEDCSTIQVADCQRERELWFSCPITCAERLSVEGSMAEVYDTPEAFFQIPVRPLPIPQDDDDDNHLHHHFHHPQLSLEDYEGYVTVVAVVPTAYPGMAQFHYQLLEHVASVYPFTVQIVLVPLDPPPPPSHHHHHHHQNSNSNSHNKDDESSSESSPPPLPPRWDPPRRNLSNKKVMILEPMSTTTTTTESTGTTTTTTNPPVLSTSLRLVEYVAQASIVAGNHASRPPTSLVWDDRVTIFLVSYDGMFIERLISPTLMELERRIAVHLLQLEVQAEL